MSEGLKVFGALFGAIAFIIVVAGLCFLNLAAWVIGWFWIIGWVN